MNATILAHQIEITIGLFAILFFTATAVWLWLYMKVLSNE
jgi:hypothetical protein